MVPGASTRKKRVYAAFALCVLVSFSYLLYTINNWALDGGYSVKDEAMFLKLVSQASLPRSNISQLCQSDVYIRCDSRLTVSDVATGSGGTPVEPREEKIEKGEGRQREEPAEHGPETNERSGYYRIRVKKVSKKPLRVNIVNLSHYFKDELREAQNICPGECVFSTEQVTEETDIVLAVASGLSDQQIPGTRWPGQVYVIFSMESPINWMSHMSNGNSPWRFAFNLTSSYNLDSDIFLPYDTLRFEPIPDTERPNYTEITLHKTKMAAWLVSNCHSTSKRHLYVKRLQRYIDVDIFGQCGQNVACDDHKCLQPYKFYISFENSFCDDYITEKLFKMYTSDSHIIPIVRGGGRYRQYLPTDTFINTADFRSAKDLATFLQQLSRSTQIYAQYLANKDQYRRLPRVNFFCHVCRGVRRRNFQPKVYDIKKWMEDQCHEPTDLT